MEENFDTAMIRRQLLLLEDDPEIARDLIDELSTHHFNVTHSVRGDDGYALALGGHFDIMIVDRLMPGMDGLTVIANLRKADITTPVLVLSALGAVDDRVAGLKIGSDDYLGKPYVIDELLARLEALLRRPSISRATVLTAGPLYIDLIDRRVTRDEREINLLPREFRLLEYMVRASGLILTRDMLLEKVWHYRSMPKTNLVDVHISNLRRKIDLAGETQLIQSVRGIGFMFVEPN